MVFNDIVHPYNTHSLISFISRTHIQLAYTSTTTIHNAIVYIYDVTYDVTRYVRYRAVLQPDMPLDPGFKYRLMSIAGSLELGQVDQAR